MMLYIICGMKQVGVGSRVYDGHTHCVEYIQKKISLPFFLSEPGYLQSHFLCQKALNLDLEN